jgi:hypothetical protein
MKRGCYYRIQGIKAAADFLREMRPNLRAGQPTAGPVYIARDHSIKNSDGLYCHRTRGILPKPHHHEGGNRILHSSSGLGGAMHVGRWAPSQ